MKQIIFSLITFTLLLINQPSAALEESGTPNDTTPHSTLTDIGGGYGFLAKGEGDQRQVMLVIDSRWPTDLNFVGGAQSKNELTSDTFIRKVKEKTGASLEKVVFLGSWRRTNANAEGANDTCDFYAGFVSAESSEPAANPDYLNSVHWFSLDELRQGDAIKTLFPPHLHFLKHFLNDLATTPREITEPDFEHPESNIVYHLS